MLELFALPFLEVISEEDLSSSVLTGQNLSRSPALPKDKLCQLAATEGRSQPLLPCS